MATRRLDLPLYALLVLHGVVPEEVAQAIIDLSSDGPPPMNLDSAMTTVHGTIRELIEAGAFGDGSDEDNDEVLDKRLPVAVHPNHRQLSAVANNESHRSLYDPPFWMVACYERWNDIRQLAEQEES